MDFETRVAFGHLIRAESVVQPADVIASAVFVSADINESSLIVASQLKSLRSIDRCLVSAGCGIIEFGGFIVTQSQRWSDSFFRSLACISTNSDRSLPISNRLVRYDYDHT